MNKKLGGFILVGVLVLGAALIAQKGNYPAAEGKTYIEVHGPNIAFVPMTEKFVKYDGKIRRIAKFTETIEGGKVDCKCPKCCDGICYVIIYTDLVLSGGSVRTLYILWMDC